MVHNLVHNSGLGDSDHECLNFDLNCYKEDCDEKRKVQFITKLTYRTPTLIESLR